MTVIYLEIEWARAAVTDLKDARKLTAPKLNATLSNLEGRNGD